MPDVNLTKSIHTAQFSFANSALKKLAYWLPPRSVSFHFVGVFYHSRVKVVQKRINHAISTNEHV